MTYERYRPICALRSRHQFDLGPCPEVTVLRINGVPSVGDHGDDIRVDAKAADKKAAKGWHRMSIWAADAVGLPLDNGRRR